MNTAELSLLTEIADAPAGWWDEALTTAQAAKILDISPQAMRLRFAAGTKHVVDAGKNKTTRRWLRAAMEFKDGKPVATAEKPKVQTAKEPKAGEAFQRNALAAQAELNAMFRKGQPRKTVAAK